MGKKHIWFRRESKSMIIEITISDETGRKIDKFIINNKKDYPLIIDIIQKRYGFSPEIKYLI